MQRSAADYSLYLFVMINYYHPFFKPFLGKKKYFVANGVKRYYYHSFEDAFWHLLHKKRVPKKSVILFPDFYCMDVLKNVRRHGYAYAFYPLNPNFQADQTQLTKLIQKVKPHVVVVFHACGITSELMIKKDWLKKVPPTTLLIEDSVHRLIDPEEVRVVRPNHFIIDSLRKVSPLPGSFLYGSEKDIDFNSPRKKLTPYFFSSRALYFLFRKIFKMGYRFNSRRLVGFSHTLILKLHDNIIGNSLSAHPGVGKFEEMHDRIDFEKVEQVKKEQTQAYEYHLYPLFSQSKLFRKIAMPEGDFEKLHVYPLAYKLKSNKKFLSYLHRHKIVVWNKFPDCPWSRRENVLFLPLGFHMDEAKIRFIAEKLEDYVKLN